jgi:hypothetical protein
VKAASGSLSVIGTSFNITGEASKLVFTTQTTGGAAGSAFPVQPVVTVEHSSGNIVTSYSTAVTLAIGTGSGTLTCTTNPVTAASGVATFAGCQISANGNGDTLKATSGALTAATSTSFNVTGTATKLVFTTQPVPSVPTCVRQVDPGQLL